jgi:hypothetical protein
VAFFTLPLALPPKIIMILGMNLPSRPWRASSGSRHEVTITRVAVVGSPIPYDRRMPRRTGRPRVTQTQKACLTLTFISKTGGWINVCVCVCLLFPAMVTQILISIRFSYDIPFHARFRIRGMLVRVCTNLGLVRMRVGFGGVGDFSSWLWLWIWIWILRHRMFV